jgi:diguanylate cyclase (GGDEF)-like protein
VEPAPGALLVRLLGQLEQTAPDGLGGLLLQQQSAPVLAELGLDSALGVPVLDPETKAQAGVMVAGYAAAHAWRPHEKYFLQAVGDQMLLGVSHTRLRTMVRTLGAADEKTGLLTRSSYLECLVQETQRAKVQGTPLTLALVQMDRGAELLRQHGEGAMERYLEQLARTLQPVTRQTDLAIKYTSWAIAFILPDTPLAAGESQAEKIRQAGAAVRSPWEGPPVALSASVAEAVARVEYDSEDIVTELINRAEAGLDEAQRRGGSIVVSLGVHAQST